MNFLSRSDRLIASSISGMASVTFCAPLAMARVCWVNSWRPTVATRAFTSLIRGSARAPRRGRGISGMNERPVLGCV
jgi:hypothetical protein